MLLSFGHLADIGSCLSGFAFEFRVGGVEGRDVLDHLLASLVGVVEFLLVATGIADGHDVLLLDFEGALRDFAFTAQDVFSDKPIVIILIIVCTRLN